MECYLDNAATTKCLPEVAEAVKRAMLEEYGNPSSYHMKGVNAEKLVKAARAKIASSLKAKGKEIIFTSGGTEANNLAIIGGANANKRVGNHIITTPIEHSSVANPIKYLEKQGYDISYIPVDSEGRIVVEELSDMIQMDTVLVSVMYVNNETGTIQPIEEIGNILKRKSDRCLFHVDGVQGFGKLNIQPHKSNIDLMSVSGHKLHGPKGTGFLYVSEKVKLTPLLLGGGQEADMRSGTENVPAISGLGIATDFMISNMSKNHEKMSALREYLLDGLLKIEGVSLNGARGEISAPHIVNISVEGVGSEVMLHSLEDKEIYVSAGSACSSHKKSKSATLSAMGLSDSRIESAIRISLSCFTEKKELDACIKAIGELAPMLRKYRRA